MQTRNIGNISGITGEGIYGTTQYYTPPPPIGGGGEEYKGTILESDCLRYQIL